MNAPAHSEDKFGALMTMRVEPIQIDGLPPLEIREHPLKEIKPLLDQAGTMDNGEFTNRLLGLSLYLDGEQLTFARVESMSIGVIKQLSAALPAIMRVYGLTAEAKALAEEPAPEGTEGAEPAEGMDKATSTEAGSGTDDDEDDPPKPKKKG